jgi:prepilin-type N-terminal cleavage/methylation domain-containing protein
MSHALLRTAHKAFTLIELLVVVAIVAILIALLFPMMPNLSRAKTIVCLSNLHQVNREASIWAADHANLFSWEISTNAGGSLELVGNGNAGGQFTPFTIAAGIRTNLICPTDFTRKPASLGANLDNTNLSYFIAPTASLGGEAKPSYKILGGDRHLSYSNQTVNAGLLETTNPAAFGWNVQLHGKSRGVLAFADGHCEIVKATNLANIFLRQAIATNRLVIP